MASGFDAFRFVNETEQSLGAQTRPGSSSGFSEERLGSIQRKVASDAAAKAAAMLAPTSGNGYSGWMGAGARAAAGVSAVPKAFSVGGAGAAAGSAFGDPRGLVQAAAAKLGWTGSQWKALENLIQRESAWNPNAKNPTSTAAGLFQFLDSTRKNYGITRDSPLSAQIDAGLRYISDRYKTPQGALDHWLARKPINGKDVGNWY